MNPIANPPEFATHEVYDAVRDADDGLLLTGRFMAFRTSGTSVIPFDAGLTNVGGTTMSSSGDYLARFAPTGRGEWAIPHHVLNESFLTHVATDGTYAFIDNAGPDLPGTPGGPGGTLARIPLPALE